MQTQNRVEIGLGAQGGLHIYVPRQLLFLLLLFSHVSRRFVVLETKEKGWLRQIPRRELRHL